MTSMHVKIISIISNKFGVNKDKIWTPLKPARWLHGYGSCLQAWRSEFNSWNAWKDGRREMTPQSCPLAFTWTAWHLCTHAHPSMNRQTAITVLLKFFCQTGKDNMQNCILYSMQHHGYSSDSDRATNCNFLSQSSQVYILSLKIRAFDRAKVGSRHLPGGNI